MVNAGDPLVIALDGPAGAGKSTLAAHLAAHLGLECLDTGAMYRAVTFAVLQAEVDLGDTARIATIARDSEISLEAGCVSVDGVDATAAIRGPEVTSAVSIVAAIPEVREILVARQRQWATERGGGVIEGRDIGSVVWPDARLKVFVTASPRVRAERRVAQAGGDVEEVAASIAARDLLDSSRAVSPLVAAPDAVVVDTSDTDIAEALGEILAILEARGTR